MEGLPQSAENDGSNFKPDLRVTHNSPASTDARRRSREGQEKAEVVASGAKTRRLEQKRFSLRTFSSPSIWGSTTSKVSTDITFWAHLHLFCPLRLIITMRFGP